jgi:hypothetical protein
LSVKSSGIRIYIEKKESEPTTAASAFIWLKGILDLLLGELLASAYFLPFLVL